MNMRTMTLALAATWALFSTAAIAGDIASPAKAAAATPWLNGYPYGSSGLYVGLFTASLQY